MFLFDLNLLFYVLKKANLMDPTAFFAMVFGSEDFEPLVGALKLATMAGADHEVSSEEVSTLLYPSEPSSLF
jgi:hypothetical protein